MLGAGVPGGALTSIDRCAHSVAAGGYDAAWVLVLSPDGADAPSPAIAGIEQLWSTWTEMAVKPLSSSSRVHGHVGSTAAAQDGLHTESVDTVPGLRAVLDAL